MSTAPSAPLRNQHPLWASINTEWEFLTQSATANAELRRWHRTHLVLRDCHTLADLKSTVEANPNPCLLALIDCYRDGSELAAKALVFAMLGKIVRLSRSAHVRHSGVSHDRDERAAQTVAAFLWCAREKVHAGHSSIAGALALLTLTEIQRQPTMRNEFPVDFHTEYSERDTLDDPHRLSVLSTLSTPTDLADLVDTRTAALRLLQTATEAGVITTEQQQLLHRAYLSDKPSNRAAIADELGLTPAAVRQRLSRAITSLRTAAAAHSLVA